MTLPDWLTAKDSKLWSTFSRIGAIFSIVTPLVTLIVVLIGGASSTPPIVLAAYVCVLTSILVVVLIRQENRYMVEFKKYEAEKQTFQRLTQYGPAGLPMRRAFSFVAAASWHLVKGDGSRDAFRLRLKDSLEFFASAFTTITGSKCRASIKLIQIPPDTTSGREMQVVTLCRDENSAYPEIREPDRLVDNTDFKQIFIEDKRFFFCNDLRARVSRGYRNSHWNERTFEEDSFEYKATIVWPIERGEYDTQSNESREIIGFLCIDTLKVGAFSDMYDPSIGAAFSQALYLALHHFRETQT